MFYQAELKFLQTTLERCHIWLRCIPPQALLESGLDFGIRSLFGLNEGICSDCEDVVRELKPRVVYLLTDPFGCSYVFFLLPETEDVLLLGPFAEQPFTSEQIAAVVEMERLPLQLIPDLENYYGNVSVLTDKSHVLHMLEAFCDLIWRGEPFELVEINAPKKEFSLNIADVEVSANPMWKMEMMEKRYEFENQIMEAVSKGQVHKVNLIFPVFSALSFEKRLSDPLRNMKNYCIIMNTLLRKAAENGGVHPVFLDKMSSEFARKIENIPSVGTVQLLMMEMFEKYCRLVHKHSTRNYSLPVQKSIIAVESNLTTDLSLSSLASMLNISPGYLAKLFKKEIGMTVTEYVTQRRMEHASNLLLSTKLQIQTIAQHCGIMDVQYFSRLFKKVKGLSPFEFRKVHQDKA